MPPATRSATTAATSADLTALYARLSQDRKEEAIKVARQLRLSHALCDQNGWDNRREYTDNDKSATDLSVVRDDYKRLLGDIALGLIKRIVCYHTSRLVRDRVERAQLVTLGKKCGLIVVSTSGQYFDLSTAGARQMFMMLGEIDTGETEYKSERRRDAELELAQKGLPHRAGRPFGYEPDSVTVREPERDAVRSACASLLAGVSLGAIAREWDSAGFRTARLGKRWTESSVRAVLTNPRIAGIRAHHGVEVAPAVWPALVPEETYRAVMAYLAKPARHTGGSGVAGMRLLTGIALCGVPGCGLTVNGGGVSRGGALYRCPSQKHFSRLARPVEDYVHASVVERFERGDAEDLLVDRSRPDVGLLREQAAALRARMKATRAEFAEDDTMSPADLRGVLADMGARLAKLEARMADAGRLDLLGPLVSAPDVERAWFAYDKARQRLVIDMVMRVWVWPPGRGARRFDPDTVVIEPKL